VTKLPSDYIAFRLKNRNRDDDTCVITNYYQHGPCSVDQFVLMELLMVTVITLISKLMSLTHTSEPLDDVTSASSARESHCSLAYNSLRLGSH